MNDYSFDLQRFADSNTQTTGTQSLSAEMKTYYGMELLAQAMRYAARRDREQYSRAVASSARRIPENGGGSTAVTRTDPRALTSEELSDIRRRVQRGEKIRF